jgi:hypothetical protein
MVSCRLQVCLCALNLRQALLTYDLVSVQGRKQTDLRCPCDVRTKFRRKANTATGVQPFSHAKSPGLIPGAIFDSPEVAAQYRVASGPPRLKCQSSLAITSAVLRLILCVAGANAKVVTPAVVDADVLNSPALNVSLPYHV